MGGSFPPYKGNGNPLPQILKEMLPPPALLQTLGFREEGQSGTLKVVKEREGAGRGPASRVVPAFLGPRKDQENIVFLQLRRVSFIHSFFPTGGMGDG